MILLLLQRSSPGVNSSGLSSWARVVVAMRNVFPAAAAAAAAFLSAAAAAVRLRQVVVGAWCRRRRRHDVLGEVGGNGGGRGERNYGEEMMRGER